MKTEKIEDAHNFKRIVATDAHLSQGQASLIHGYYQSYINDNYVLKTDENTYQDHINNKSIDQV